MGGPPQRSRRLSNGPMKDQKEILVGTRPDEVAERGQPSGRGGDGGKESDQGEHGRAHPDPS
jgi:hypothetical protein